MKEVEQTYEPPKEYTPNNICFWEVTSKELKFDKSKGGTAMLSKAKHFLENDCIVKISETEWVCKRIEGYNKTDYKIKKINGELMCECQGYVKKKENGDNPICSHYIAVLQFEFINQKNEHLKPN